jgi:hypothetical protein
MIAIMIENLLCFYCFIDSAIIVPVRQGGFPAGGTRQSAGGDRRARAEIDGRAMQKKRHAN